MKSTIQLFLFSLLTLCISSSAHAYVLGGSKWDSDTAGVGASISWAFATNGSDCRLGIFDCADGQVSDISGIVGTNVHDAFAAWANAANLTFTETTSTANPDILIGAHTFFNTDGTPNGLGSVVGHAFTSFSANNPNPPLFDTNIISDIHLDTADLGSASLFNIIAHEIGHSLGLDHTDIANSLMNATVSPSFSGPQADDIAGIQALYGAPTVVPVPGAFWLMLSAFSALSIVSKRKKLNSTQLIQA